MTKDADILTQKSEGRDRRSTDDVFALPAVTQAAVWLVPKLYHLPAATPVTDALVASPG